MAAFTLSTEAAIVQIILQVATDTCPARLALVARGFLVAVVTGRFDMPPIQHEARGSMIKIPGFPGAGVMTGLALGAKEAIVFVIFLMTSIAGRRRIVERRRLMAFLALHPGMAPGQRKA